MCLNEIRIQFHYKFTGFWPEWLQMKLISSRTLNRELKRREFTNSIHLWIWYPDLMSLLLRVFSEEYNLGLHLLAGFSLNPSKEK